MSREESFEQAQTKKFIVEQAKHHALRFALNDIISNQYTQSGYDEKEALKCVIEYAKQRLEDLGTL